MSGRGWRLGSLEVARERGAQARRRWDYRQAIERTNVTGLASLGDYRLAFGPLARENREWLCAQMPLLAVIDGVCGRVSGVPAVGMYPPGQPLPDEMRQDLARLEDVVTATGTQVLETRESNGPLAADCSVSGRQECALLYLTVGDAEGNPIRRLVWQRHLGSWQHSRTVLKLAARKGLSRVEYEAFHNPLSLHLPPVDDPNVVAKVRAQRAATSADTRKSRRPWITYADISDLISRQEAPNSRSDPVRSGQKDWLPQ